MDVSSPSLHAPPPVLFLSRPEFLAIIQKEITEPPDPAVLPWEPPPDFDEQAVMVRIRLDKAAREKRAARAAAGPAPAPTRVQSSFAPPPSGPIDTGGGVDFSTAGSFFSKAEVGGSSPAPSKPAFGEVLGHASKKKDEDGKRKPRAIEENVLDRLKTNWLQGGDK